MRKSDGRLVLRDSAMVAEGEDHFFQDTDRHPWFHANNLWVDLDVLAARLAERDGILGLPIIVNRKTVDPTRPDSTPVIQVESAMGAAVEVFDGSRALAVDRSRFRPVKTTNELLLIRSDLYRLTEDSLVESTIDHDEPFVDLGAGLRPRRPASRSASRAGCPRSAAARACGSRPTRPSAPASCAPVTCG